LIEKFNTNAPYIGIAMDLWHLKIFMKVVDFKSFSNAAKAVSLTQPTVSSHIKELENYFDCRLIDRLGKKAIPTKAGELLYSYSEKLMQVFKETETAMLEYLGKVSGKLAVGGSTIPGNYFLPRIIGKFLNTHQQVQIALTVGDTEQIIEDILSFKIDAGVVGARVDHPWIMQTQLLDDDMRLIVPAAHPWASKNKIHFSSLSSEPFIARESGSGTLKSIRNSLEQIGKNVRELNIVAEMGSTSAVIQGIKNRIGISILSTIAVKEELAAGTLKALKVDGLNLKRHFYLTVHQDRTLSPLCTAFVEFIKESGAK
jgi:DNA-binding transcriptional LysR family regulator